MADQKEIKLYQGEASPSDIRLYPLPVADGPSTTTIYLYPGQGTPSDIMLRSPVSLGSAVTHSTSGDLAGQGAQVVGSASRTHVFSSTGALTGAGSAVSGSANRVDVVYDTTCGPLLLENGSQLLLEDGSYLLKEVGACADVSTTPAGVGRGGKRNVRPKFLEIDGKLIRVQNDEEVYRYLDRLKQSRMDKVKATAPKAAAKALQGETVQPPTITYEQVDFSGLQAIYDRIAQINQDIELAYLLRVQREQQELDDEEALLLLL